MTNARASRTAREKAAAMQAEAARKEARRKSLLVALAAGLAVAVIIGVSVLIKVASDNSNEASPDGGSSTPRNITNNAFVVGDSAAPVTLTIYEDFQCPACQAFEQLNADQIQGWVDAGTVKVEYRTVAILDHQSTDDYSTRSANAAAAVIDVAPTAFEAFHTALFANQPAEGGPGLTDDKLIELAVAAGAPEADVRTAVTDLAFAGWVESATKEATEGGLQGTPTLKVNGEEVKDYAPETVKKAVEAAAAEAGATASPSASPSASASATTP